MRARIDISEVEARTKIRAKYLRAIENEEWDLLPGPVYVKSFLRTYGDFLGLDSRMLVDEFKRRTSARPTTSCARSRRSAASASAPAARARCCPPWAIIGVVLVGDRRGAVLHRARTAAASRRRPALARRPARRRQHRTPAPTQQHTRRARPSRRPSSSSSCRPARCTCAWSNGAGKKLIPGQIFSAGRRSRPRRAPKLLLTLGNAVGADEGQRHDRTGGGVVERDRLLLTPPAARHIAAVAQAADAAHERRAPRGDPGHRAPRS